MVKKLVDILAIWVMQNSLFGVPQFLRALQFHPHGISLAGGINQKRTMYVFYRDVES